MTTTNYNHLASSSPPHSRKRIRTLSDRDTRRKRSGNDDAFFTSDIVAIITGSSRRPIPPLSTHSSRSSTFDAGN
ncbi:hypothetical protein PIB30_051487, partial [Stylosanthes scabra]|nr:hypothetical protein [Stylosanthes scabra]